MLSIAWVWLVAAAPSQALERHLTLDVQKAPIAGVLHLLAERADLNLVIGDDVQGTVSLRLRDVTVRTALEVVLSSHALGMELQRNVLRIAPLKQLADEAEQRARLRRARKLAGPKRLHIIPIHYARAADLAPLVQSTLTENGSVSVDARTNSLIVQDVE